MRIVCTSDLHGYLPEIPDCDILLLAGDYCPTVKHQERWFLNTFRPWLEQLSSRCKVIGIAGNHDFIFERTPILVAGLPWTYLEDSGCTYNGVNFYGTPWQPAFNNWAFNATEAKLSAKWRQIPTNTDVLILHGPPHGYGDFIPRDNLHTGSRSLTRRINSLQMPLAIAGHIHEGHGKYMINKTTFLNCSIHDAFMRPVNSVFVVDAEIVNDSFTIKDVTTFI